jgi:hypothetical protein
MTCNQASQGRSGVYAIRNTANGKLYVGSAALSFKERWRVHRSKLRRNRHPNSHLQAAWIMYGERAFEFVVLEKCSPSDCLEREQWWMVEKRTLEKDFGYNLCPVFGVPTVTSAPYGGCPARRSRPRGDARIFAEWLEDNGYPEEAAQLRRGESLGKWFF